MLYDGEFVGHQGRIGNVRRAGVVALRKAGLTRPAYALFERYKAARAPSSAEPGPDGLPLPPPLLMIQVVGSANPDKFLLHGLVSATVIRDTLARHGVDLKQIGALLDFGCGCGRAARWWKTLGVPEVHGCDYNPALVEWCRDNLPFMDARHNDLGPPLPYEDGRFDLVYALSVFTHLSEPMQHAWMAEMRRAIRPGGHLLFTTMGAKSRPALDRLDRSHLAEAFDAGRLAVSDEDVEGTNRCVAYHPRSWVEEAMLDGFELLEFTPAGPAMMGPQDLYLLRREG